MTRLVLAIALFALLAAPLALAQHGPPPGYTDPVAYAQDYAAAQSAAAQADPVGYAQDKDAVAEAEHAAWLACWTAYDAAGHVLDPACAAFFTAPGQIDAVGEAVTGEITQVLNDTGADALLAEVVGAAEDTVKDPLTALDQVQRIAAAAIRFVEDLIDFVLDLLGFVALGIAAGLLGAAQGLLGLLMLPLSGLQLAGAGLIDVGALLGSLLHDTTTAIATAATATLHGVLAAGLAILHGMQTASTAAGHGVLAVVDGLHSMVQATTSVAVDTLQATAHGLASATDAIADAVSSVVERVGSLFDGKSKGVADDGTRLPSAPKTGTDADGLIDRLLGAL